MFTLEDVDNYFPFHTPERQPRPEWEQVEDEADVLRAVVVTKKQEAIRSGSFTAARLMQHLEALI